MRISDWSSDVCSSDLHRAGIVAPDFAMHFGWPIGCEPSIAVGDHRAPRRTGAGAGHFEADLEDSARRQPKSTGRLRLADPVEPRRLADLGPFFGHASAPLDRNARGSGKGVVVRVKT